MTETFCVHKTTEAAKSKSHIKLEDAAFLKDGVILSSMVYTFA
jgi:hypothetical protein